MPHLSAGDVARITGGEVIGSPDATASRFTADSRTVAAGSAFVAIRAGHGFLPQAFRSGAAFAVVTDRSGMPEGMTAVVVTDHERALFALADEFRSALSVRAIGITGSTGKTLTKDMLAAALRTSFKVHAAVASYNNEVGLPLTILGCPDDADVLVCELGARAPGQIAELAKIVRPEVGIVTGIGWTHLEVFGSRDAIASTKAELLASLPASGLAVVPAQDDYFDLLVGRTAARVRTVGAGGHVRVRDVSTDELGRPTATIHLSDGRSARVRVPLPGVPLLRNAALALAAATGSGAEPHAAAEAISTAATSAWRMEVHTIDGRMIVNDAYNANPTSVVAALRTVRDIARGRPAWAVLGEMAELGSVSDEQHERIGRVATALGYERVIAVGAGAALIAQGAGPSATRVHGPEDAAALVEQAPEGAVVLIKGSRVTGLERLVSMLPSSGVGA